ncbi:hypothetical protein SAMN04488490_1140 [Marinobacter sp. LV10R510-11A]|uniref:hypothetical protein n=1 Tax=Marinobacter sp. LV10R510-11A TaxID=1415568 RepID=UPI000BB6A043|nr:hypothetical protein [Marinobacter sp. LV10R510-11A]SOB75533.1 hypothetical protein SAMN04488490_1140 [Marinobacter sp. LV10R510-11A]
MLSFLLLIGSITAGFIYSSWFFIASLCILFYKLHKWYYYQSKPWRIVHFPMMRSYAQACGIVQNEADQNNKDFQFKKAVILMLDLLNPVKLDLSHEQIVEQECMRLSSFYDKRLIRNHLKKSNIEEDKIDSILHSIKNRIDTADNNYINYLTVRMVIASVLASQFDEDARGEYVFNIFNGRAV